jgi:hypothetical protein
MQQDQESILSRGLVAFEDVRRFLYAAVSP